MKIGGFIWNSSESVFMNAGIRCQHFSRLTGRKLLLNLPIAIKDQILRTFSMRHVTAFAFLKKVPRNVKNSDAFLCIEDFLREKDSQNINQKLFTWKRLNLQNERISNSFMWFPAFFSISFLPNKNFNIFFFKSRKKSWKKINKLYESSKIINWIAPLYDIC